MIIFLHSAYLSVQEGRRGCQVFFFFGPVLQKGTVLALSLSLSRSLSLSLRLLIVSQTSTSEGTTRCCTTTSAPHGEACLPLLCRACSARIKCFYGDAAVFTSGEGCGVSGEISVNENLISSLQISLSLRCKTDINSHLYLVYMFTDILRM